MPDDPTALVERVTRRFRSETGAPGDAQRRLAELLAEEAPLLAAREVEHRARELAIDLVGLGPLEHLLADPSVTDVLVNGPGRVWVERDGRLALTDVELDRAAILTAIERLVAPLGLSADRSHPVVDGRLPDGTRVAVVLDPVAVDGPLLAIRRHAATRFALTDLAPEEPARILRAAVRSRANLLVYGATGSGKTTLLNSLGAHVPPTERVVVIEDVAELRLPGSHVVRLEAGTRTSDHPEGLGLRPLVRAALRLRPDRIVLGEVRGAEAVDMVWALSTGHRGCMASVHASGPQGALERVETMVVSGLGEPVPLVAVRRQVCSAIDIVVGMGRTSGGDRRVIGIHRCGDDGIVEPGWPA